jgi:ribosome-binding protein aMBF1 (putative translation factor)
MYSFEAFTTTSKPVPAKHSPISSLIDEFSSKENGNAHIQNGRRWVAETFYGDDVETIRTLRLRKGWSQSQLAAQLNTSQSHVARIERGTENVTIDTCRRLSSVLGVDLNQLNQALMAQEKILREKQ